MKAKTNENVNSNIRAQPRLPSNPRLSKQPSEQAKFPSKASQSLGKFNTTVQTPALAPAPKTFGSFPSQAKPSQKLTSIKITDAFLNPTKSSKTASSGFQHYYHNCMIPCKINHGSITNKIIWEQNVDLGSKVIRNTV